MAMLLVSDEWLSPRQVQQLQHELLCLCPVSISFENYRTAPPCDGSDSSEDEVDWQDTRDDPYKPGNSTLFRVGSGPGNSTLFRVGSGPGNSTLLRVGSGPGNSTLFRVGSGPGNSTLLRVGSGPGNSTLLRVGSGQVILIRFLVFNGDHES